MNSACADDVRKQERDLEVLQKKLIDLYPTDEIFF